MPALASCDPNIGTQSAHADDTHRKRKKVSTGQSWTVAEELRLLSILSEWKRDAPSRRDLVVVAERNPVDPAGGPEIEEADADPAERVAQRLLHQLGRSEEGQGAHALRQRGGALHRVAPLE